MTHRDLQRFALRRRARLAPLAALAMASAQPACAQAATQAGPSVATASGPVVGATVDGVDRFLGIPYAAPPVGPLRWRPPAPIKPWTAPRRAAAYGSTCPQNHDLGVFASAGGAEDCLFVNVFAPHATAPGARLPVLVWIHGGGYSVGHSNGHDGGKLAVQGKTVVVSLNYRLGALGFLAHKGLDTEGHPFADYGLMDQQAALRWVKANIARFGGDPARVTIFGESSGGTSVMSHIISPGSAGLFSAAIAMSGSAILTRYPAFGAPRPLAAAEDLGRGFADAVGCADQSPACLRAVPLAKILAAQPPFTVNQAIIDGTVLPRTYADAFAGDRFNHVALVNGSTQDEWRWAAGFAEGESGKVMTAQDYPGEVEKFYGKDLAPRVLAQYPLGAYNHPAVAFASAVTDSLFACTALRLDHIVAGKVPVYAYEFSDEAAPSYIAPTSFPLGAAHTFEIQYLFPGYRGGDGVAHPLNADQRRLSDRMVALWSGLGRAGGGEPWARFDPARDNMLTLIAPEPEMRERRFAGEHKCAFWDASGLY